MRALALLHRWTGGILGLVLAVIGLSGVALVWEDAWIGVPGAGEPYRSDTADLARATQAAYDHAEGLTRVTYAGEDFGLHMAAYADGGGAYIDQAGRVVESWSSIWGRAELWLFDLHHYLLLGHSGENLVGTLGLVLVGFTITGLILWWRTRKTFAFRLWPKRLSRSAIVRQHRDLGVVASPVLLLSALTGSLMLFQPMSDVLLAPWSDGGSEKVSRDYRVGTAEHPDFAALLASGQGAFPEAQPRRLMMPRQAGAPAILRLKQDFEWTPNGRSYAYLDPATAALVGVADPADASMQQVIEETYYPLHAGKVGGLLWKLALSLGGLALALLGMLASWSFWFRRKENRSRIAAQ